MTTPTPTSSAPTPSYNSKSPTIKRILREAAELSTPSPSSPIRAHPLDTNLFEWHFTLLGPPSTPYSTGIYHGRITLPPTYPFRPPSFRFLTPSGRFEVNREICLSISGHHEDTWQPAWGVRTAVVALRAFMAQEAGGQVGGLEVGEEERRRLARESRAWKCGVCGGGGTNEMGDICVEGDGREKGHGQEKKEEIPAELRLAYRGEGKKEGDSGAEIETGAGSKTPDETQRDGESTNWQQQRRMQDQRILVESPLPVQVQQTQSPAQPTQPTPSPAAIPAPQIQIIETDDENFWIDRAIGACVFLLAAIVLRKLVHIDVY